MVPSEAGLGGDAPQAFVDGLHTALLVGAALAAVGAIASARLIGLRSPGHGAMPEPAAA